MKNFPTKVIIRRLPPKLREADFLQIVDPLPPHSYFRFCTPDPTLGNLGMCRAYITFQDLDALFAFKERFDNYVFVDSEGNESLALVEFAVYQVPTNVKDCKKTEQVDKKQGTLHEDPDFISFLKTLQPSVNNAEPNEATTKKTPWEATLEEIQARASVSDKSHEVTPLLAYLEKKRKDEDVAHHKKKFKRFGNPRKEPRGEQQIRTPPASNRRDVKRGSAAAHSGAAHGKMNDEITGADVKSSEETRPKPSFDMEEFPAIRKKTHPSNGSMSAFGLDRQSVWGVNSSKIKGDAENTDSSFSNKPTPPTGSNTSKPSTPTTLEADVLKYESDRDPPPQTPNRTRAAVDDNPPSFKFRSNELRRSESPQDAPHSDLGAQTRDSGYRGRRATYYPTRSQSGGSDRPQKSMKSTRGRRDSDSGSLTGNATGDLGPSVEPDSEPSVRSQGGRGWRGRGSSESHSAYFRGGYRGGHQNFRNADYNDDPYSSDYPHNSGPRRGHANTPSRGRVSTGGGVCGSPRRGYSSRGGGRSDT
ncbi:hypothetical protein EG68_05343 [Paragonimus skrjabini miyazakii]|uniref:UPF3 domain-containing protein n=1 Tax=Paragonimus skrjabini miyazakii TaxID=59628 RepID=A0A8S9YVC0_9TREM|nr:hypothetical protein EG68_05343 [Paragonimus skrjabini miyazakii]